MNAVINEPPTAVVSTSIERHGNLLSTPNRLLWDYTCIAEPHGRDIPTDVLLHGSFLQVCQGGGPSPQKSRDWPLRTRRGAPLERHAWYVHGMFVVVIIIQLLLLLLFSRASTTVESHAQ